MLAWLTANLGTIIITLALIAIVAAVIVQMVKDKKQGKGSCGCDCENCAMHGKCHK
jgi:hypothetical protein